MPHWTIALVFAMIAGAIFGAGWALIPAYLQAKRGSHVVITTIMFNFIATALMGYLLIGPLKLKGAQESASASFPDVTNLPTLHELLAPLGISFSKSAPANVSLFIALAMCVVVYLLMNRSRLGYEIRAFGESPTASVYAGISPTKIIIVAMMLSGAISGLMAINATMGQHERLILNAVEGAGFIGIAVALMGRNHPFGVLLAALAVRLPLSGRQRAVLVVENPPRADRGHSGSGDPVHRRIGQHGAHAGRAYVHRRCQAKGRVRWIFS